MPVRQTTDRNTHNEATPHHGDVQATRRLTDQDGGARQQSKAVPSLSRSSSADELRSPCARAVYYYARDVIASPRPSRRTDRRTARRAGACARTIRCEREYPLYFSLCSASLTRTDLVSRISVANSTDLRAQIARVENRAIRLVLGRLSSVAPPLSGRSFVKCRRRESRNAEREPGNLTSDENSTVTPTCGFTSFFDRR